MILKRIYEKKIKKMRFFSYLQMVTGSEFILHFLNLKK